MFKLRKQFFHRDGDGASSRAYHNKLVIYDGTQLYVNVELSYYPRKKPSAFWYVSISSQDKYGRYANTWHSAPSNCWVRKFIKLAIVRRHMLATLPYKQRKRLLESFLKKALDI